MTQKALEYYVIALFEEGEGTCGGIGYSTFSDVTESRLLKR